MFLIQKWCRNQKPIQKCIVWFSVSKVKCQWCQKRLFHLLCKRGYKHNYYVQKIINVFVLLVSQWLITNYQVWCIFAFSKQCIHQLLLISVPTQAEEVLYNGIDQSSQSVDLSSSLHSLSVQFYTLSTINYMPELGKSCLENFLRPRIVLQNRIELQLKIIAMQSLFTVVKKTNTSCFGS